MNYIFNLNEKVEVLIDGPFWGAEGYIVDVAVDSSNNTIYGVELGESVVYFLAMEINLV